MTERFGNIAGVRPNIKKVLNPDRLSRKTADLSLSSHAQTNGTVVVVQNESSASLTAPAIGADVLIVNRALTAGSVVVVGSYVEGTDYTILYGASDTKLHNLTITPGTSLSILYIEPEASGTGGAAVLPLDFKPESAAITEFGEGYSIMLASAGANFGPSTGEAGILVIERNDTSGIQTFTQTDDQLKYDRVYTGGAWTSWQPVGAGGGSTAYTERGPYSSSATYFIDDVVSYQGSTWIALQDSFSAQTPAEGAYWTLMSSMGEPSYTTTTASYTQPAYGLTISVTVGSTFWMAVGETVYVQSGGYYYVSSITDATHVVLENAGITGNAAAGSTITSGKLVSPAGPIGPQGVQGQPGGVAYSTLVKYGL